MLGKMFDLDLGSCFGVLVTGLSLKAKLFASTDNDPDNLFGTIAKNRM